MPLPWKKAKRTRISQLVADHLPSPKRGGSLVVETGFPTSLIDLFVKNRDRLKKPSKKKRFKVKTPDPIHNPSPPSSPTAVPPCSERPNSPPLISPCPRVSALSDGFDNEIVVVKDEDEQNGLVGDGVFVVRHGVFRVIFKMMFVVVVLGLLTKKFVVGIIVSAFLLLFMEYAVKHLHGLVNPCADAHRSFWPLIKRVLPVIGIKKHSGCSSLRVGPNMNDTTQEITVVQPNPNLRCSKLMEGQQMNYPIQEIEIVQPSPNVIEGIHLLHRGEGIGESGRIAQRKEVVGKEKVSESDTLDLKTRRSPSSKIKSKIKKFVSKKFRSSKKNQLESKSETSCSGTDNQSEEKEHVEAGRGIGSERDNYSCSSSSWRSGEDKICNSSEISVVKIEETIIREHARGERKGNSGYLIVFLIVLVGLVAGRVSALALTLSWYLLLKSFTTLKRALFRNQSSTC